MYDDENNQHHTINNLKTCDRMEGIEYFVETHGTSRVDEWNEFSKANEDEITWISWQLSITALFFIFFNCLCSWQSSNYLKHLNKTIVMSKTKVALKILF